MGAIQCAKRNRDSNPLERDLPHRSAIYLKHRLSVSAWQETMAGARSERDGLQGRTFRRQEADVSDTWAIRRAFADESKHGAHFWSGNADRCNQLSHL